MSSVEMGIVMAIALAAALLVPYLFKEIRKGKARLGRGCPPGRASPIRDAAVIRRRDIRTRRRIRTTRAIAGRNFRFQSSDFRFEFVDSI